MMEIFDNGYLSEDEKSVLDTQTLICLAAANYSGKPMRKMYPRHIYKYCVDKDERICRLKYTNVEKPFFNAEIMWEDYICCDTKTYKYPGIGEYYLSGWMDDDGIEHTIEYGKFVETIDMAFVGRDVPYYLQNTSCRDGVWFLRWEPDCIYGKFLKAEEKKEQDE